VTDGVLVGEANNSTSEGHNAQASRSYILGDTNTVVADGAGSSGGSVTPLSLVAEVGYNNQVTMTNVGVGTRLYNFGDSNTYSATACTLSINALFGYNNSSQCATTGTNQYMFAFGKSNAFLFTTSETNGLLLGFSNSIQNCSTCMVLGSGITNTTSNSIDIGLSATPEIIITAGNVKFNAATSSTGVSTATDCEVNSVSPAACGSAAAGAFVVPTTTTTYTVNTTAVKSTSSHVILEPRGYTGALPSSPTCVAVAVTSAWYVSAVSAGASFTVALPSTTGQTCWDYFIVSN
jgi:hypothetical protein